MRRCELKLSFLFLLQNFFSIIYCTNVSETVLPIVKCNFKYNESKSAYDRASTQTCKEEILQNACKLQMHNLFASASTDRLCPQRASKLIGCVNKSDAFPKYITSRMFNVTNLDSVEDCIQNCFTFSHKFAFYQSSANTCFCVLDVSKKTLSKYLVSNCDVLQNSKEKIILHSTGIKEPAGVKIVYPVERTNGYKDVLFYQPVRIVFLLSVNGRSVRQILRLFKLIYSKSHYYYFFVDPRMIYLKDELLKLKQKFPQNVHISNRSFVTIWGGADLLKMHLNVMEDLVNMSNEWKWDYLINLSETDLPLKTMFELTEFLTANRGVNFLKFRQSAIHDFIRKQGLNFTFHQCDDHMWKLGPRKLIRGIQYDGGSDWFCLHSEFIKYLVRSNDAYLGKIKEFYTYTLLPSESFFHTAILNSPYCDTYANSHLRYINWRRGRGCNCQYKAVVDWCGCSPNVFTADDTRLVKDLTDQPVFFARKFDPIINQQIINLIDQTMYGIYTAEFESLNSYWYNEYSHVDDTNLQSDRRMLFDYLLKNSIEQFLKLLNAYSNVTETLDSHRLELVHSLFEAEKFKGFILRIKIKTNATITSELNLNELKSYYIETYFNSEQASLINVFDENSRNVKFSRDINNVLVKSLLKIQIGTNYDSKEYILRNYASIMGQDCNPTLFLRIDALNENIELIIEWTDPDNKVVKQSKAKLVQNENEQIILHTLFKQGKNETIKPGLWNIKLYLNQTKPPNENYYITIKFLILPTHISETNINTTALNTVIRKFWKYEEFCLVQNTAATSVFDGVVDNCQHVKSHWSTYYPDPKSSLIGLNYTNANVDRMINMRMRLKI